jgi:hypothetical protein
MPRVAGQETTLAVRAACDDRSSMSTPMKESGSTGMEQRMDEIRLKQMLGGALTDQELMCLQIEANGFGCGSCPGQEPPTPTG